MSHTTTVRYDAPDCAAEIHGAHPHGARRKAESKGWLTEATGPAKPRRQVLDYCPAHRSIGEQKAGWRTAVDDIMAAAFKDPS